MIQNSSDIDELQDDDSFETDPTFGILPMGIIAF
jgi:hypothetical protein